MPRSVRRPGIGFNLRENVLHGALIVLGEVDFNPGKPARPDGVKRVRSGELAKRAGGPVLHASGGDEPIHNVDKHCGPFRPEFYDSQVFAIRLRRVHGLRHLDHPATSDLDLHLLVAEGRLVGLAIREEQRILVAGGEQVVQKDRVKENVTIQYHEPLIQQRSCHPKRVHAVGLGVTGILNIGNTVPTGAPDPFSFASDDHRDVLDASALERLDLPLHERDATGFHQALRRFPRRAVQPGAATSGQNNSSHYFPQIRTCFASGVRPRAGGAPAAPWP